jgi:hypothetical protein
MARAAVGPGLSLDRAVFSCNLSWNWRWRRYREFMRYCSRLIVAAIFFAVTPLSFAATPSADEVLAKARTAAAAAHKKIFLRFDASW